MREEEELRKRILWSLAWIGLTYALSRAVLSDFLWYNLPNLLMNLGLLVLWTIPVFHGAIYGNLASITIYIIAFFAFKTFLVWYPAVFVFTAISMALPIFVRRLYGPIVGIASSLFVISLGFIWALASSY